jgi:hypothetical protein
MTITFQLVVCLVGAMASFSLAVRLKHFKLQENPPRITCPPVNGREAEKVQDWEMDFVCQWLADVGWSYVSRMACKLKLRGLA